jgi:hypothetical protein
MLTFTHYKKLTTKHFRIICGSLLLSLPIAPYAASAAPSAQQNPCPRIFYEEPFNSTRLVPQGCAPNVYTRTQIEQGRLSVERYNTGANNRSSVNPTQSSSQTPSSNGYDGVNVIATIPQGMSAVNVRLKNATNTRITYQVIGQTDQRYLAGGEEVELQNLSVPVTFTLVREDNGFIKVKPISTSAGQLAVSLNATGNPNESQKTLRIQQNGQVLAY